MIVHTVQDLCVAKFHSCLCDFPGPWLSFGSLSVCWCSVIVIWTKFPSDSVLIAWLPFTTTKMYRVDTSIETAFYSLFTSLRSWWAGGPTSPRIYSSLLNGWTENAVPLFRICTDTGIIQCLYVHPKKEEKKFSSLTLVECISLSILSFYFMDFFFLSSSSPRC